MRAFKAGLALTVSLLALAGGASAEALPSWSNGWSGQATLYGWFPTINGKQQGFDGEPIVDLDQNDLLSRIDMAFMGSFELRKDRFSLLLDAVYLDTSNDAEWLQDRVRVSTGTKIGMYTVAAAYRAYEAPGSFVDIYAGGRFFDTQLDFGIATDNRGRSGSADLSWSDPIVGLRGGYDLSDHWSLHGFADAGGFDGSSDLSWQIYGGANYAFNDHWDALIGYRYLSILYEASDLVKLDMDIQGPLIGIAYRF